jgi:transposase
VYLDEAHIHQDADLGYGWLVRGERLWVCSNSPRLSAKVSFYGLYLYNQGQTEIWPYPCANGDYTVEVLTRLRQRIPTQPLKLLWDGAPYHRALQVYEQAAHLNIEIIPLPAYSPDFMPVEALWRWLREEVTDHHCHVSAEELIDRVEAFRQAIRRLTRTLGRLRIVYGSRMRSIQTRKNYAFPSRCGIDWFCLSAGRDYITPSLTFSDGVLTTVAQLLASRRNVGYRTQRGRVGA